MRKPSRVAAKLPAALRHDAAFVVHAHVHDRPAVLFGECKDRDGRIDADDITKLGALSARLEESGLDVYVVFAKLGPFTEAEITEARTLNGEWSHRVVCSPTVNLSPITRTSDTKWSGALFGGRLEDSARNSERLYPGRGA